MGQFPVRLNIYLLPFHRPGDNSCPAPPYPVMTETCWLQLGLLIMVSR